MEYEKHTHKNLFEIKVNMTEQSSDFKGLLVKKKPARRLVYFDRTGWMEKLFLLNSLSSVKLLCFKTVGGVNYFKNKF